MTVAGVSGQVDVAVLGAGPAGFAAGLSLARAGASVAVIDRSVSRPVLGEGLPPSSTPILQTMGIWDRFVADGHREAYGNRSVWGSDRVQELDFVWSPYGKGWHLDRRRFDAILANALRESGAQVHTGTRVLHAAGDGRRGWRLTLSFEGATRELHAAFVVDATGRARYFARMQGARRYVYDRLVGLSSVLAPKHAAADPDRFNLVQAVADGWWYVTGLPDGRLVAGFMTDADNPRLKTARSADGWMALLEAADEVRRRIVVTGCRLESPPTRMCADSSQLDGVTGNGWCAAGDAAAAYDPLSSLGITTALMTGIWAAEAVCRAHEGGMAAYEERIRHLYARYLARWLTYYDLERRWPTSPFWRRRHAALERLCA